MTGLIWLVQIVHYPTFELIDQLRFKKFHELHANRITYIVAPVMLLELISSIGLIFICPAQQLYFWILLLILLVGIWISTAFLSIPLHNQLSQTYEQKAIMKLVKTNWLRTALWSLRSLLLLLAALNSILNWS